MVKAQDERLSLLLEEMGEAIQIIGKIQRHGWDSSDPTRTDARRNVDLLAQELGDVKAAMTLLIRAGDIGADELRIAKRAKLGKLGQWLHHEQNVRLARSASMEASSK